VVIGNKVVEMTQDRIVVIPPHRQFHCRSTRTSLRNGTKMHFMKRSNPIPKGRHFFRLEQCQGSYPCQYICAVQIRILDFAERDLQSGFFFMRPSSPVLESIFLIQFIQKSTLFYSLKGFTSRSSFTIGSFAEDFPYAIYYSIESDESLFGAY